MNKTIIFLFPLLINFFAPAQNPHNLDFEEYSYHLKLPKKWFIWGNYIIGADTLHAHSGKYSGKITSNKTEDSFGSIAYRIPVTYEGKSIRLEGYMKTKDVKNGFAGLLLRIDGKDKMLGFDNMKNQNIHGTNDWHKYSITLPFPEEAERIYIAGILVGKGEAWFDDYELTIDGKNIQTLKEKEESIYKADLDKEFDSGSQISFPALDENLVGNLDLLGKVWGFLKYYHPAVGAGEYNWDYELFRILPKYLNSKNDSERDVILVNWINTLGEVKPCKSCKDTPTDAVLKPDLTWIDNNSLSNSLISKLKYIQKNRHQGNHYYIGMTTKVGNSEFKNENPYSNMAFPDSGFRLLALYRYWNMMQYFNPNRRLTDKNWNDVLSAYIPKFINAKTELEYELTLIQVIGEVNDTHANLSGDRDKVEKHRGFYFPPVHLRFIENKLIVDDYFNPEMKPEIGLEIGDVITHVNQKPIEDILKENHDFYPASNQSARLRDMSHDILRSKSKTINITYLRNKQSFTKELQLFKKADLNYYTWYRYEIGGESYKMLDHNIGYITLKNIRVPEVRIIRKEFIDTQGIIVDIRNYPAKFMPFVLGSFFTSKPSPFVKFTIGNVNNPGEFSFGKTLSITPEETCYKGKVVVLVNELSQSQAEYTAMAFRAGDNVTIMGSTTAGADGNVSNIPLPGGLSTRISGIGVYYPDGRETQRVGIVPDVEVKPTIIGIKQGRDEVLEKAIEYFNDSKQ
ncbi:S41 family peptidase [Cognatitamlana onchidii]|uniref:S41 family peptidase n=1 Tax=Cognatitamlana onchidii TaxID=2562860 RepID=UPI0010A63C79|nr:S41 family peptidase [Algibacter onchidii]